MPFITRDSGDNPDNWSCSILLGGNRGGGTPDPISNSEVKPSIADGTAHKSVEE
jgi:hypothetical protein